MIRPNFAFDAPPETVRVGSGVYRVNTDYRIWLTIIELSRELFRNPESASDEISNIAVCNRIQALAFGGVLADESIEDVLGAIAEFIRGYPCCRTDDSPDDEEPVLDFGYDIDFIVAAVRNQSGRDLSYRNSQPFHWWEFLLEVRTLCSEHYILRLMRIRAESKNNGSVASGLKRRYALPVNMSADERRAAKKFDEITGG